ncbi:hypothetical protein NHH82_01910 [Oxalobacteraceae bacterium OTU3REALA1]|nr:hypothetical protein NHH82_01910 [Oxalobacteraceae bacterium OTU3REALA1]
MNFKLKSIVAAVIVTVGASAYAQTAPVVTCAATGPGAVACVGAAVAVHEIVQLANGKKPLGPNGEGMKIVNGAGDVVADIFGWGRWLRRQPPVAGGNEAGTPRQSA